LIKLENALEDCLARIHLEGEGLEECLARYPELSKELRPLLMAAKEVQAIGRLKASPEFKALTRAALGARLRASTRRAPMWRNSPAARYAAGLAAVTLFFVTTGTALAQYSLPGETLYGWKLGSEHLWYNLHNNPISADLALAERRVDELLAVKGLSESERIGVEAYADLLHQLERDLGSSPERAAAAQDLLNSQKDQVRDLIENSSANIPSLDELFYLLPKGDGQIQEEDVSAQVTPASEETPPPSDQQEPSPTLQLPLLVTLFPTGKKGDEPIGGGGNGGGQEPTWLENLLSDLLGLP